MTYPECPEKVSIETDFFLNGHKNEEVAQILIDSYSLLGFSALFIHLFSMKGLPSCWPWRVWGLCILSSRFELRSEFTADIRVESLISNSSLSIELSSWNGLKIKLGTIKCNCVLIITILSVWLKRSLMGDLFQPTAFVRLDQVEE